jgi:cell division protein ZapA
MAAVIVNIAGRTYRLSCDDGEEPRLEQLARYVESKILSMKEGFGEIGDQRLVVMAALTFADAVAEAREAAEAERERARADAGRSEAIAATLDGLGARIEELAARLAGGAEA